MRQGVNAHRQTYTQTGRQAGRPVEFNSRNVHIIWYSSWPISVGNTQFLSRFCLGHLLQHVNDLVSFFKLASIDSVGQELSCEEDKCMTAAVFYLLGRGCTP